MIRLLVAEDVRMLRETLATVLGLEPDIEVVAKVEAGDGILSAVLAHRPDVAILDIDLIGVQ